MHWSSPRLNAGLKILEASIAPSAAPAPTMVCNSSMKMIMFFAFLSSSITALILSSNWPRYLVPATIRARSKVTTFLSRRFSGTIPPAICWAKPSTMAVFPTPASPISTGLFLVLLHKTWVILRISASRPTTGSISPFLAISVRSRPNALRAGVLTSLPLSSDSPPPTTEDSVSSEDEKFGSNSDKISFRQRSTSISRDFRTRAATPSPSLSKPKRMCSVPT